MADWYYVGHYGQLGPLTREQIDELIEGGVIGRETYVWKSGMATWMQADSVAELASSFAQVQAFLAPPPPPMAPSGPPSPTHSVAGSPSYPAAAPYGTSAFPAYAPYGGTGLYGAFPTVESDRSRVAAGILQLFLPGIGRMYLGYMAIGVLQLLFCFCTLGIGWLWSFIDGIVILAGAPKLDGYGRVLKG